MPVLLEQMCKNFESKHYTTTTFFLCPTREGNHTFDKLHTLTKEDTCDDPKYFVLFLEHVLEEIEGLEGV